jgi:hypothetical protein
MQSHRRSFLARGLASACAVATAAGPLSRRRGACRADPGRQSEGPIATAGACPLDYGLSFICNPSPHNAVRFWVESRTTLIDEATGERAAFYQCASCKSENTFAEKGLFQEDNYDFLPIFGGKDAEDLLIFRRPARRSERYRQVVKSEEVWGRPILKLRRGRNVQALATWEAIRDATAAGVPIVGQTEIENADTGLRAIIECPVKTMNVSLDRKMYQVDTGPIAFADLSRRFDPWIACLRLAFIAFNAPHFADFVIEQPTPVIEGEREVCEIYHYSNPISLAAKNRLLAVKAADC